MDRASRVLLLVLVLSLRVVTAQATQPALGQIIPLDMTGPRLTTQLVAGGHRPVTVIFDTGCTRSVINTALAESLGLENQGATTVGSPGGGKFIPAFFATIPLARMGDAEVESISVVVADLPLPLPGISGVMSPNIFSGSLVRFELANARALVVPKAHATIPAIAAWSYTSGEHGLPAIVIDVAGVKVDANVDTGSRHGLCLPIEVATQIRLKSPLAPTEPLRRVGGEHHAFTAEISGQVRIGPLTLTDPTATFVEGVPLGNVGFSVLKNLVIVLDPAEKRSWLLAQ